MKQISKQEKRLLNAIRNSLRPAITISNQANYNTQLVISLNKLLGRHDRLDNNLGFIHFATEFYSPIFNDIVVGFNRIYYNYIYDEDADSFVIEDASRHLTFHIYISEINDENMQEWVGKAMREFESYMASEADSHE